MRPPLTEIASRVTFAEFPCMYTPIGASTTVMSCRSLSLTWSTSRPPAQLDLPAAGGEERGALRGVAPCHLRTLLRLSRVPDVSCTAAVSRRVSPLTVIHDCRTTAASAANETARLSR
jgi:hypothetical protein